MSFGKLYSWPGNSRTSALLAVAKANKLDVEVVDATTIRESAEFVKLNPLGKVPAFEGSDGYALSECLAINVYFASQNEKTTLLGKTKQDYASILRWMSFANSELLPHLGGWFCPLVGRDPYNKKNVEECLTKTKKALDVLEKHLLINTFLVGERLTLADLFATGILDRAFMYFFDEKNRKAFPCLTRYYETISNQPVWTDAVPKVDYPTEMLKNQQPKVESKKLPVAKPKPAAEDDDEDEPKAAPKPKHPLEALGKPTLTLDDWKRKYSNAETREEALPWFWENYKPDEYSLWKVDYKYNEELTMTFMTSNLIGGFFARLEASRKYLFGACSVFGVTNDSVVKGVFLVRGQDAVPAFDVAPDWESYEFTKLDHTKPEDKEFVNDQWAWDKPVVVNGKPYEWADGKVFK